MAQAVESEKRRSIGFRLLLDDLRKKKDQQLRQKMVHFIEFASAASTSLFLSRQSSVDAKRKQLELLKLQTGLILRGNSTHQDILDHFAP